MHHPSKHAKLGTYLAQDWQASLVQPWQPRSGQERGATSARAWANIGKTIKCGLGAIYNYIYIYYIQYMHIIYFTNNFSQQRWEKQINEKCKSHEHSNLFWLFLGSLCPATVPVASKRQALAKSGCSFILGYAMGGAKDIWKKEKNSAKILDGGIGETKISCFTK